MPSMNFHTSLASVMSSTRGLNLNSQTNSRNVWMVVAAMICIVYPLEISQLIFALIGALVYAVLQAFNPRPARTNCQLAAEREQRERDRSARVKGSPARPRLSRGPHSPQQAAHVVKPDVYQQSSVPVFAPKFESIGWEAEVGELISQLTPGIDEDQAVQRLVLHVKQTIQTVFPGVEVTGFAHGSLKCGKAFGVAVPEVDIVANVSPAVLAQRLQQRTRQVDAKKLQKSAIRTCTDRLVSSGGLKFRRSAFRGEEPRVTLLVPVSSGFFTEAIPVDFSINSVTPFYTAALLTECGQIEPRAKALILLVKRWAKDRAICHAAKGHLSPYIWSLLVMYFMQVGVEEEGPLLPSLKDFKISSNLMTSSRASSTKPPQAKAPSADNVAKLSVADLFCKFIRFYNRTFNWTNEAISIRSGQRGPPGLSLPLHIIVKEDGSGQVMVGPAIEDPFKAENNLGTCLNTLSLARLHEELKRADELCTRTGASLTELLEPWVPIEDKPVEGNSGSSPGEQDDCISKMTAL